MLREKKMKGMDILYLSFAVDRLAGFDYIYSSGDGCQTIVDNKLYVMNRQHGIRDVDLNTFSQEYVAEGKFA